MKKRVKGKCEVPSCDEPAFASGLCQACYAGMRYWNKKGVGAIMERRHKLKRLEDRMEMLGPANVVPMRRQKVG